MIAAGTLDAGFRPPKIQGTPSLVPRMPLGASGLGMETEVNAPPRKIGIVPALT